MFDEDRYWIVEVDYAKADPTDLLMTVRVTNAGPEAATLHVLPTTWFRNTWSWELDVPRPRLRGRTDGSVAIDHPLPRRPGAAGRPRAGRGRADRPVL